MINDVDATRRGIRELLARDGYAVETASGEQDAARSAWVKSPDLMLVSLEGETGSVIECVERIRERSGSDGNAPVIIFCSEEFAENETAFGNNIFLSCPDNFNQLRSFISRLLREFKKAGEN